MVLGTVGRIDVLVGVDRCATASDLLDFWSVRRRVLAGSVTQYRIPAACLTFSRVGAPFRARFDTHLVEINSNTPLRI